MTTWTIADLANLTEKCIEINEREYCEHCSVVPIADNDKYCIDCLQEMLDDLAMRYNEQFLMANGWY